MLRGLRRVDLRLFRRVSGWRLRHRLPALRSPVPTPADRLVVMLSHAADMSRLWLATGGLLAAVGDRAGKRAAIRGVGSIAATSLVVNAFVKPLARRRRPPLSGVPAVRRVARQPLSASFPSGHAASATAFVTGVALEHPAAAAAIAPLAAGVAYSRVYVGVHYPSDVVAGAALGGAMALASLRPWPRLPPTDEAPAPSLAAIERLPSRPTGEGVHLVHNPQSGAPLGGPSADALRALMPRARIVELADDEDPLPRLRAAAAGAEVLGVCGGDGTLAAAAEVALEAELPLLLVPGGTMNHLAHDLGIESPDDAVAALAGGEGLAVDVGLVDGLGFVNNASLGSYTHLVETRRKLERRLGRWPAQFVALWRALAADPVTVEIDGRRRRLWLAFIGNCAYHARGIAPGWRHATSDGMLDVRIVWADRRAARWRALAALLTDAVERSKVIERRRLPELRLDPVDSPLRLVRDGEPFEATGPLTVRKHPRTISVYAPAPS
jgi:diacylglycerol kinase family enzyme/membrane-associated phospholipid phosphatase